MRIGGEGGRTIVFGGDLGRYDRPVLRDPEPVAAGDVLLVESTYGDRRHDPNDNGHRFGEIVRDTIARGGKVLVPAFAIGRVEEVLYWLKRLEDEGAIPEVPVYLDSPMATEALQFYVSRNAELDDEFREAARPLAQFVTRRFTSVATTKASEALAASGEPSVVISSSGMATGGRVLNHLERVLPDPRNTVVFVGYQAAGTRGRSLVDGAKQVKMHGVYVTVAAQVARIDSMSAHADGGEIVRWLRGFTQPPARTFIVHGEPPAMQALQRTIAEAFSGRWKTQIAKYLETVEI
jgi:metallo-beta-lactamase family protein